MTRYLITSALPYINGIKHLGNLIGSMLPADVYARFLRQSGKEVLFICGTDEHGTPAELAAEESAQDIETYCLNMYQTQKHIYEQFKLSFDYFGRSSSHNNHVLTTEIFNDLLKNKYIEKKNIAQYYSYKDQRFLPDRYIMGTCPKCHYEKARGDQCDKCGSLLDPNELINPYSAISKDTNLELRESEHFFLKLQTLQDQVQQFVDSHDWNNMTKGIAKKWLKEGLKERCISRDLKWGIPIPNSTKVFYVWFDAPNAYISITQDFTKEWQQWWLNSNDVLYTQFMAKDNVPFHSIFWPAVLMGTKKPWHQVDQLKSFSWLTYNGDKFSTSQKRGVFMDQALEIYPSDYWRYYLLANIPETDDTDFSFSHFSQIINKDLADILGNFINRTFTLIHKYFKGTLPFYELNDDRLDTMVQEYKKSLEQLQFRQALSTLRKIWDFGNEFIALHEPWKLIKIDSAKTQIVLSQCVGLIRLYAVLSKPIIPDFSDQIMTLLNQPLDFSFELKNISTWHLNPSLPLFKKISDEEVEIYTKKFEGHNIETTNNI